MMHLYIYMGYSCKDKLDSSCSPFFGLIANVIWCFYRAALGWFAFELEWYDTNYSNFAQCEAQSVSLFVQYLSNMKVDTVQVGSKGNGQENGNSLTDTVIFL